METIGHTVIPPPDHVDLSDIDSMNAYMQEAPVAVLLFFVVLGWLLGCLMVGGLLPGYSKNPLLASFICGTVLLVSALSI